MQPIQMSQLVYDALKSQYHAAGEFSEYVFCNQAGQPIDNQNFLNRVWNPLLRQLGLARRRAYQMRHTAATLWLASGEAPEWIVRQLGHLSTEMLFRVYSRYVPNLARQDGSAMERLLASRMSTGANVQTNNPPMPSNDAAPPARTKLRGITGGRAIGLTSGRTNALPDYFGDAEPQPPPLWHGTAVKGTGSLARLT